MTRKLGRLPNRGRRRVSLRAAHVPPTYTPPPAVDYYSAVPAESWGDDGNSAVGDCTCADVDHEVKAVQVAAGNPEVTSTEEEVLAAYSAITGYDPVDPSTDQGAEMQTVREYWRKIGFTLGGQEHKILLFADLDITDANLVKWALDQFGAIGLGVDFPDSAEAQFEAGEPWTVVRGSESMGGHAIALVGYREDWWEVVTWGRVQRVSSGWLKKYVEEAWTALSSDFVNEHSGTDPLGDTLYDLGQQFAAVTKQPNPVPPPAPTPSPGAGPADDADRAFAAALKPWLAKLHTGDSHRIQLAGKAWLAEKGLN